MTTFMSDRSLMWRRGLRGLGAQVCDESGCYDDGTNGGGINTGTMNCPGDPGCPGGGGPATTTTTGGINWTAIFAPLAQAGATIGKMFAGYANPIYNLPPGTYYQQTPYGTVVSTQGAVNPASSANLSSMMPLLLVAGGVVLVISMAKK